MTDAWRAGGWTVERLRDYGAPATLIDVGAARGTPPLYDAFPEAHLVAIEPLRVPAYDRRLALLTKQRGAEVHRVAVGAFDGTASMEVDRSLVRSSLLPQDRPSLGAQEVPVRRLDSLAGKWPEPFGLKLDVEGYEVEALRGAGDVVRRCRWVISEAHVKQATGAAAAELIALMAGYGFAVCDVLDAGGVGGDAYVDLVFKPTADIDGLVVRGEHVP